MLPVLTHRPRSIDATEKLMFSVYDLDHSGRPNDHEFVTFTTPVASHSVTANTTVEVTGQDGDGTLHAQSTRVGVAEDNPTDPLAMTQIALDSKISVTYVGLSSWKIRFLTRTRTRFQIPEPSNSNPRTLTIES